MVILFQICNDTAFRPLKPPTEIAILDQKIFRVAVMFIFTLQFISTQTARYIIVKEKRWKKGNNNRLRVIPIIFSC